jgi:2-oxoisovalerate dehydrogenase E2 component (dihydrolipoyl transacylase)
MSVSVLMPKLGESVVEGTVARWLKAPGERVDKLEPLLEITTDKIDTELPAPAAGVLLAILVPEGTTVAAGTALATIGEEVSRHTAAQAPAVEVGAAHTSQIVLPHPLSPKEPAIVAIKPSGRDFVSPLVKRIAREHALDVTQIAGSGLGGRVTKRDVLAVVERRGEADEKLPVTPAQTDAAKVGGYSALVDLSPDEMLQPLSAMRRAIAQHMLLSKQTSPHVTTVFEVDMAAVVQHRERHKTTLAMRGVKLTFTPYFVAAVSAALRATPLANSRYSEQGIVLNQRIHIGVAVAVANGLLVPVIRDADEKNLAGLARSVGDLAERARTGKLLPDELRGGTFTITNHGVGGSLIGTPIINQPQAGILGIGAIVKRPVVRSNRSSLLPSADDAIVIRPMCYLSFSFDHRILDGASADQFLTTVKETLENWRDDAMQQD